MISDLDDLDAGATLRLLEDAQVRRRRAEVDDLLLVLRWADLHGAPPIWQRSGGESFDELGGEGTPGVAELSLCELGIARGVHTLAARAVVADALDLRHRLPLTWAVVTRLEAEVWVARKVARMSRKLSREAVAVVDSAVAAAIAGHAPSRVLEIAEAKVIEADQPRHEAMLAEERAKRYVALSRRDATGLRNVIARVTDGDAAWVDAMVARVAEILAERPEHDGLRSDELRSVAFGYLARPVELLALLLEAGEGSEAGEECESRATAFPADLLDTLRSIDPDRLRPKAVLYVHLHQEALETGLGVARVEGLGPVALSQLRDLLGHTQVTVKPVLDLADWVATNAYEHPEHIKERMHLLRIGDAFPHATRVSRLVDADHIANYDRDGPPDQTNPFTSQPLSRTPHRAKTHLAYRCRLDPTTSEVHWTTPHGLERIVGRTGTRVP